MVTYDCLIPLPEPVHRLAGLFSGHGYKLHAVGGVVRDYLLGEDRYKGEATFSPKDIDLCTDARPDQVHEVLEAHGVRNFGKGEAFGVWVAHVDGADYEIATFREDLDGGDGRRPGGVRFCDEERDAARRDLTINALYYVIPPPGVPGQVLDYGSGLADLVGRIVRVVGDPHERFREDKLRILRLVRFWSRYVDLDMTEENLGSVTWHAVQEFRDLRALNVSGPRIMGEFCSGVEQAMSVSQYLWNLFLLGLFPAVFPDLSVRLDRLSAFDEARPSTPVVLANIFRHHPEATVRALLNRYNYPNEVSDEVSFLIRCFQGLRQPPDLDTLVHLALALDRTPGRRVRFSEFGRSVDSEVDSVHWRHLVDYRTFTYDGEAIMKMCDLAEGVAVGRKIFDLHRIDMKDSLARMVGRPE